MGQLSHVQSSPEAAFKAAAALKALSLAAGTLERPYGLKSTALGLDNDPTYGREIPELVVRNITQAEIDAIQRGDTGDVMDDEMDDEILNEDDSVEIA